MTHPDRETSLIFSLRELEDLERERVTKERTAEAARRLAAEEARLARVAGARQAEARRENEARALLERAEQGRRAEALRVQLLERATTERVREEVRERAKAALDEVRRSHELELVRHRAQIVRGRYRWLAGASFLVAALVGGFAFTLSAQMRAAERAAEERSTALEREHAARVRAASDLADASAHVRELQARLSAPSATSDLRPTAPKRPPASGVHVRSHGESGVPPHGAACTGDGDPLNGCLE